MGRMSLGEMIRDARHAAGLRLEDVAAAVGVTPGALSHIESGRRLPNPKNAFLISKVLGIPSDELIRALDEEHSLRRAQKMSQGPEPVFRAQPVEALFGAPHGGEQRHRTRTDQEKAELLTRADEAMARADEAMARMDSAGEGILREQASSDIMAYSAYPVRYRMSSPSRDAARWSNSTADRLAALESLAADASDAIRTLRGLLEDEDPVVQREARRLLRELDVRLPEE